ncbi:uncharacterized protein EV154DRAFT_561857 [Mucor mucedo]|uniref:uncharacterized protein n=1 Tax=Mucor mucedo TaxID=29922 RepID=UPI0022209C31|nr:uncharacterized protein EV154DRAFT_561857 [Mucor mucedo]KAI7892940.1 hypothetical protein EV154DRAFT_561857 [Mucor mucedo]
MSTITGERALCMLFYKPYTEENVNSLAEYLRKEDLEICYTDEPTEPVLVHSLSITHNPFRYRTYVCKKTLEPTKDNEKTCILNSAQIILLLNTVYLPHDPENSDLYENKVVAMKEIYCTALKYSDELDAKNLNSFMKWCSYRKLDFLQVETKRKIDEVDDKKTTRTRSLYALKDDYLGKDPSKYLNKWPLRYSFVDDVADKINNYLPSYQSYIKKLKEEGYTIIGYIRKSPGKEPDDRRRQLLKTMSLNLKERSLVDVVFASPCSRASDPVQSRDQNQHPLLDQIGELFYKV